VRSTDRITVPAFVGQFTERNPERAIITECWTRLGPLSAPLDMHHILATTYMIHLESMMHREHLPQEHGRPFLSDRRREIIKHFGRWVDCHCKCGRKWNYANSQNGMQRDVNSERKCVVDGWMKSRIAFKWRYPRGKEWEKDNRKEWFER
jgi:hypothetical protein